MSTSVSSACHSASTYLQILTLIFSVNEVIISWFSELSALGRLSLYFLADPLDSYSTDSSDGPALSLDAAIVAGEEEDRCRETVCSREAAVRAESDMRTSGRARYGIRALTRYRDRCQVRAAIKANAGAG